MDSYPLREEGGHDAQDPTTVSAGVAPRLVELVRAGKTPEELAGNFEPSAGAIRNEVVQTARDDGPGVTG